MAFTQNQTSHNWIEPSVPADKRTSQMNLEINSKTKSDRTSDIIIETTSDVTSEFSSPSRAWSDTPLSSFSDRSPTPSLAWPDASLSTLLDRSPMSEYRMFEPSSKMYQRLASDGCNYNTDRLWDLRKHENARHDQPEHNESIVKLFDCPDQDCGLTGAHGFKRKDHLREHTRRRHQKELFKYKMDKGRELKPKTLTTARSTFPNTISKHEAPFDPTNSCFVDEQRGSKSDYTGTKDGLAQEKVELEADGVAIDSTYVKRNTSSSRPAYPPKAKTEVNDFKDLRDSVGYLKLENPSQGPLSGQNPHPPKSTGFHR